MPVITIAAKWIDITKAAKRDNRHRRAEERLSDFFNCLMKKIVLTEQSKYQNKSGNKFVVG